MASNPAIAIVRLGFTRPPSKSLQHIKAVAFNGLNRLV